MPRLSFVGNFYRSCLFGLKSSFATNSRAYKNYYKILGVGPNATSQQIKEAYIALSKKYHPDVAGDNVEARSNFIEINEAFSILSKDSSRKEYDFQRKINAFSDIESGFRMEYPKPESLDPKFYSTYENEMRRRWNARLDDWVRGQSEYELERGFFIKPLPAILNQSYVSHELAIHRSLMIGGLLAFICALGYIYKDVKNSSGPAPH